MELLSPPSEQERYNVANRIWQGQFHSLVEAQNAVPEVKHRTVFSEPAWLERQSRLWSDVVFDVASLDDVTLKRPTNLPLLLVGLEQPVVVDLGGGSGWTLQASLRAGARVRAYEIVELPEVVKTFHKRSTGPISWRVLEEALSVSEKADVLYSNSALQYLSDNSALLTLVAARSPRYILLDELFWTRLSSDWFTIQTNSDLPVVSRFIAVESLIQELDSEGYKPCWSALVEGAGKWSFPDMSDFDPEHRIPGTLSLLFHRR